MSLTFRFWIQSDILYIIGGFYSCTGKAKARDKAVVHWKTLETGSIVSLLHWKTVQMFIESREIGKRMTALENQEIFMKKTAN